MKVKLPIKKKCCICKTKLKLDNIRIGYGEYWCINHWSASEQYVQECQHCNSYFLKDGFHTICKKCIKVKHHSKKTGGWSWITQWKICPICEHNVQLCVINWMYDWTRCPNCLVAIPLPKYIIKFLNNPLKKKIKKICKFQRKLDLTIDN